MKTHYHRNLPHIQPAGGTFFVTFRLKDSLPNDVLDAYQREKEARLATVSHDSQATHNEKKRLFAQFDDYLDRCLTEHDYLKQNALARIVMEKLHNSAGQDYDLISYCVMPNHVHAMLDLARQVNDLNAESDLHKPLYSVLKAIKGTSANSINKYLGRSGPLWQKESYDHLVRNPGELDRIIQYVLNNPVKAGLVKHWPDWPYTYLKPDLVNAFL